MNHNMTKSASAARRTPAPRSRPATHPSIWVAALCGVLLAPESASAQEVGYYVRLAPGFSRTAVEHTKEVSVAQLGSFISSESTAAELTMHLAGGFRGQPGLNWFLDVEVEAIIYAPRSIEGIIEPSGGNAPHDIGPGDWEYTNKNGMGLNFVLERKFGRGSQRILAFAGVHRMQTEVASGGTERTGAYREDREIRRRWPFTGGGGVAWGPMHLRVSYFSSLILWDINAPELEVHYSWRASGLTASLGVEAF